MDFALLTMRLLASRSSNQWVRRHVWDRWYICSAWLNPSIISQPGTSVCHHHLTRPTFLPAMSGEGAARYLTASQWAMYRSPRRFWDSWLPSTLMEHVRRKFAQFLICHQELSKTWGRRPKSWIALNSVLSRMKQTGIHPRRMLWWKNHERSFPHVQVKPLYAVIQSVGRFDFKKKTIFK